MKGYTVTFEKAALKFLRKQDKDMIVCIVQGSEI